MKFSLPSSRKEMKDVCIQFDDGNCSSAGALSYIALPHCSGIVPATTWVRYCLRPPRGVRSCPSHKCIQQWQLHLNSFSVFLPGVIPRKTAHRPASWLSCCHISSVGIACLYFDMATRTLTIQTFCPTTGTVLSPACCTLVYHMPSLLPAQGSSQSFHFLTFGASCFECFGAHTQPLHLKDPP